MVGYPQVTHRPLWGVSDVQKVLIRGTYPIVSESHLAVNYAGFFESFERGSHCAGCESGVLGEKVLAGVAGVLFVGVVA